MSTIAVILPVYNVRPYLRAALDSLLAQSVRDWTAVFVDDGSTDGSGDILDEYAARDGRFRVIHQANGGVSAARARENAEVLTITENGYGKRTPVESYLRGEELQSRGGKGMRNYRLTDKTGPVAGIAVVDPSSCLSYQGLRCEVCFRECPEQDKAITIDLHPRSISRHAMFIPTIHPDHCTGCGLCTKGCPTDKPAIRIVDRTAVLGKIGEHYRLGWLSEDDPKNQREGLPDVVDDPNAKAGGLDFLNENAL